MRINLKLRAIKGRVIPYNYFYPLSAAIYKLLNLGSQEYATFLHDHGYKFEGKNFKLFTFALKMKRKTTATGHLLTGKFVDLIVSSPKIDEFIQVFVKGSFFSDIFSIKDYQGNGVDFVIESFHPEPEPEFNDITSFVMMSPLLLPLQLDKEQKTPKYILADQPEEANMILTRNLERKYRLLYDSNYETSGLLLEFDQDYLAKTPKPHMKMTIREGTPEQTELKAIVCPFRLSGDKNLMKVGYECGFGLENSMGFGLANVFKDYSESRN